MKITFYVLLLPLLYFISSSISVNPLAEDVYRGVTITVGSFDVLCSEDTINIITQTKNDLTPNWIAINFHLKQDNATSSVVYSYDGTPSDPCFSSFVKIAADTLGYKVLIKPLISTKSGESWLDINPSDPDLWFSTYADQLIHFIEVAPQISAVAIGVELATLSSQYPELWSTLIATVRYSFQGDLTYACIITELNDITWWSQLDWIGLDAYLPLNSTDDTSPSVDTMTSVAVFFYDKIGQWQATHYPDVPMVFTETGFPSYTGCAATPWEAPDDSCEGYTTNFTAQAQAYEGLFGGIEETILAVQGVFMFHIDLSTSSDYYGNGTEGTEGPTYQCGYTPRGKAAYNVIQQAFADPEEFEDNDIMKKQFTKK